MIKPVLIPAFLFIIKIKSLFLFIKENKLELFIIKAFSMSKKQFYGIKYPFSSDSIYEYYLDLNDDYVSGVQSKLLHLIFTPRGQKLRDPEFGSDLIQFIFSPSDDLTLDGIKEEINRSIKKYVPEVIIDNIETIKPEGDDHTAIVNLNYTISVGNKKINKKIAIQL